VSVPKQMNLIEYTGAGGPEVLHLGQGEVPQPARQEVLIRVQAAGVNRPDILQRMGRYPLPADASPILGLEVAGEVVALGAEVQGVALGDKVCALTNGGGYAQYCRVPMGQLLPWPKGFDAISAAALPETFFTVWANLFQMGRLRTGETVLVHGGTSGIGTTAIQLAAAWGARVFATAGSDDKARACERLGAVRGINYRTEDFVEVIRAQTEGKGVDVVLDMVAGSYVARNLDIAALEGRIVVISLLGGARAEINLGLILTKRLTLTGSTLRSRTVAQKSEVADAVRKNIWPLLSAGRVRPVIHATFPLADASEAHRLMETSSHIGKIVLTI
jgi:NADPH2:quinone reductase